jgi:hypothetical protein
MKKDIKKLSLRSTTLRHLGDADLGGVAGGGGTETCVCPIPTAGCTTVGGPTDICPTLGCPK